MTVTFTTHCSYAETLRAPSFSLLPAAVIPRLLMTHPAWGGVWMLSGKIQTPQFPEHHVDQGLNRGQLPRGDVNPEHAKAREA